MLARVPTFSKYGMVWNWVVGRRSFAHRSAVAWNALPDNVKDSPNLSIFKYNLKQSKQTVMNINFEKGGNVIQNMKPNFHYY